MRRFYTVPENIHAPNAVLTAEETKHLRDVLRLREGAEIAVFDGIGNEYLCSVESISKYETKLSIIGTIPSQFESFFDLTLAAALMKGEKFDLVVQKACELGVQKIIPLQTRRSDVRLNGDADSAKRVERWRRIALESSKQCGRTRLPEIGNVMSFEQFSKTTEGVNLLFSERNGTSLSAVQPVQNMTAVIGPEGGWDDSELETASAAKMRIITLGGRILRAETAGIVVPALLQNHFGDLK